MSGLDVVEGADGIADGEHLKTGESIIGALTPLDGIQEARYASIRAAESQLDEYATGQVPSQ